MPNAIHAKTTSTKHRQDHEGRIAGGGCSPDSRESSRDDCSLLLSPTISHPPLVL